MFLYVGMCVAIYWPSCLEKEELFKLKRQESSYPFLLMSQMIDHIIWPQFFTSPCIHTLCCMFWWSEIHPLTLSLSRDWLCPVKYSWVRHCLGLKKMLSWKHAQASLLGDERHMEENQVSPVLLGRASLCQPKAGSPPGTWANPAEARRTTQLSPD